jgi:NAD(P)-dependent dehydrogenase (short-subunit alcohol dehydrogenase family)
MADHVAVVTGGGRGIGAAIARRLGTEGPTVVIAGPGPAPDAWTRRTLGSLRHLALAAQLTPLEGEFDLLGGTPVPPEPEGARRPVLEGGA